MELRNFSGKRPESVIYQRQISLEQENLDVQLALAESEEKRLQSELDTQLAIAELAEVVING